MPHHVVWLHMARYMALCVRYYLITLHDFQCGAKFPHDVTFAMFHHVAWLSIWRYNFHMMWHLQCLIMWHKFQSGCTIAIWPDMQRCQCLIDIIWHDSMWLYNFHMTKFVASQHLIIWHDSYHIVAVTLPTWPTIWHHQWSHHVAQLYTCLYNFHTTWYVVVSCDFHSCGSSFPYIDGWWVQTIDSAMYKPLDILALPTQQTRLPASAIHSGLLQCSVFNSSIACI